MCSTVLVDVISTTQYKYKYFAQYAFFFIAYHHKLTDLMVCSILGSRSICIPSLFLLSSLLSHGLITW